MSDPSFQRLVEAFYQPRCRYGELAPDAAAVRTSLRAGSYERAAAGIIWAYCLLREDARQHQADALPAAREAARLLVSNPDRAEVELGDDLEWVYHTYGLCEALIGEHHKAITAFDALLGRAGLPLSLQVKVRSSRAFSLYRIGRAEEGLSAYEETLQVISAAEPDQLTSPLRYEQQRLLHNLAEHHLVAGDLDRAAALLEQIDASYVTPLLNACILATQARLAVHRDEWEKADELACRALDLTEYIPVRIDALGVRITVAGHAGRYQDQLRMCTELAALAQYRR